MYEKANETKCIGNLCKSKVNKLRQVYNQVLSSNISEDSWTLLILSQPIFLYAEINYYTLTISLIYST